MDPDTIIIPPGMHAKKWLLINSQRHDKMDFVTDLYFDYKLSEGGKEKVVLALRKLSSPGSAPWQKKILRRKDYRDLVGPD